jgi:glutamine amidotransferase-like uncharacterized protein
MEERERGIAERRGDAQLRGVTFSRLTPVVACLLAAACHSEPRPASILLFDGNGTSAGDVSAVETVLERAHLDYSTASSVQLNRMSPTQLHAYRLLIVPGGDFVKIGNGLTATTAANLRGAVRDGVNYLGICAGAFFAGNSPYNGLNLTSGMHFPFYAAEARGIRKAAVQIMIAGSSPIEQYWEDGPQLSGWGDVVAKFDDGTPAVAQGKFGDGSVLLLGTHPEAPDSWHRGLQFSASGEAARAYAGTLIDAALNARPLAHY